MRVDRVQRRAHHQRIRLADEVGLDARRATDQRCDRARRGHRPLRRRPGRVRVRSDEARAVGDETDRLRDALEAVRTRLADDDVIGIALGERVARTVERRRQARLADHEGRAAGTLVIEEARGRERRRPDRLLGHVEADPAQPRREIALREDRVVGQDEKRNLELAQAREEAVGSGNRNLLVDEDTVHVHQPGTDLAAFRVGHAETLRAGHDGHR